MKTFTSILLVLIMLRTVSAMEEPINIHGFLAQGFLKTNHNNFIKHTEDGTCQFNEMGLNFSSHPTDSLMLSIQLFASDFGDIGNDELTVSHANATCYYQEWLSLKAGIHKVVYGFYGDTRDMDMLRAYIFLPSSVYPEAYRDCLNSAKGIEIQGNICPPTTFDIGDFFYRVQYGLMDIPKGSGIERILAKRGHTDSTSSTADTAINLVMTWDTPIPGLRVLCQYATFGYGLKGTSIDDDFWRKTKEKNIAQFEDDVYREYLDANLVLTQVPIKYDGDMSMLVYGLEYTWKDFVAVFEEVIHTQEFDITLDTQLNGTPFPIESSLKNKGQNYYYALSYRFDDGFKLGVYYAVAYPDKDDKKGKDNTFFVDRPTFFAWQKDSCVSLRFDFNEQSSLKLEGHYIDGGSQLDHMVDLNESEYADAHRYWYMFAAKLSFNF